MNPVLLLTINLIAPMRKLRPEVFTTRQMSHMAHRWQNGVGMRPGLMGPEAYPIWGTLFKENKYKIEHVREEKS